MLIGYGELNMSSFQTDRNGGSSFAYLRYKKKKKKKKKQKKKKKKKAKKKKPKAQISLHCLN